MTMKRTNKPTQRHFAQWFENNLQGHRWSRRWHLRPPVVQTRNWRSENLARIQIRVFLSQPCKRWRVRLSTHPPSPKSLFLWTVTHCQASFQGPADSVQAPVSLMEWSLCSTDVAAGVPSNQTTPLCTDRLPLAARGECADLRRKNPCARVVAKAAHCCHRPQYIHIHTYLGLPGCLRKAHTSFISKSTLPIQRFTLHYWKFHSCSLVWFRTRCVFFLPSWFWHLSCFFFFSFLFLLSVSPCSSASSFTTCALWS